MRCLCILAFLAVSPLAAAAVTQPTATIESEGIGTVEAAPDYAEFWLHRRAAGKSVAESAQNMKAFEAALQKELTDRQLTPLETRFSSLAVPNAANLETKQSVRLRFSVAKFSNTEDGPAQFAKLCDDVLALAWAVQCIPEGPILGVSNTKPLEQAAVALAAEKAYPAAEAMALVMKMQIFSVDNAKVLSIVWNQDPHSKAPQPDIRRVTCTARVQVCYSYGPSQH